MKNLTYQEVFSKIKLILKPETSFYFVAVIYGIGISILTLAVPISVQSLVNTVSFGILILPIVILSIVLLSLLIFSGILKALQTYIVEIFQRRFYARTTLNLSHQIIESDCSAFKRRNPVSLINRYFDVMTVQKSLTKLLVDGVTIVLQSIVGLLVLAFYHPYFLVFDILLVLLLWMVWALFGKRALKSAVYESKAKYKAANWFQEVARTSNFFKRKSRKKSALKKSEEVIDNYIQKRRQHFYALFGQTILLLIMYAVMSSLILGLGGFLVIKGELTLGQLVAAELIITIILSGFSKAGKHLESFYDLYAAVDKLSEFHGIKIDRKSSEGEESPKGYELDFQNAAVDTTVGHFDLNYKFEEGKNYFIRSKYNSLKLYFIDVVQDFIKPKTGKIKLGGVNFHRIASENIRDKIHVVDQPLVFDGTIKENLAFGLEDISEARINEALEVVDLLTVIDSLDNGIDEHLLPSGYPLWASQMERLEIAKAIIAKPDILIITEIIDHLEEHRRNKVLDFLMKTHSTVIVFSHRDLDHDGFDNYLLLDKAKTTECVDIKELRQRSNDEEN